MNHAHETSALLISGALVRIRGQMIPTHEITALHSQIALSQGLAPVRRCSCRAYDNKKSLWRIIPQGLFVCIGCLFVSGSLGKAIGQQVAYLSAAPLVRP